MNTGMPTGLVRRLESVPGVRRAIRLWATGHDRRILSGPSAGARFDTSASSPRYATGTAEYPVQMAIAKRLGRGKVFYDIGANVGFFTVLAARLTGPSGRVVAFEPVPANIGSLRRNVALNGFANVSVVECAVADSSRDGEMLLARLSGGSALTTADAPPDTVGRLAVRIVAVDDLVEAGELPAPDVVKIDVEGAELAVLQGMDRTIRSRRPVILFEVDDEDPARVQQKRDACDEYLRSRGYRMTLLPDSYQDDPWTVQSVLAEPEDTR